jgi:IS5 family transposase
VDAGSDPVQTVIGTPANVNDMIQCHGLLRGEEALIFANAGYQSADKRSEAADVQWHISLRPSTRRALDKQSPLGALLEQTEKIKGSVRTKAVHPFRVIQCLFGFTKVCYRGLAKTMAQALTLFLLSNLWMVRNRLAHRAAQ